MDIETLYHNFAACQLTSDINSVDRENGMLLGYVVAQEGEFKSTGRGSFNSDSLQAIINLTATLPKGLKSRFTHPTESDDGLGKFLGRSVAFRRSETKTKIPCVRADLKFDKSAYKTPNGNLADYVMSVVESDSDAISSSLVLRAKKIYEIDNNGMKTDKPPLWIPTQLYASDIVDTGDAVDGILSPEGLPNGYLYKACYMLDLLFPEMSRQEIEERLANFTKKYLDLRFGEKFDFQEYKKQLTAKFN